MIDMTLIIHRQGFQYLFCEKVKCNNLTASYIKSLNYPWIVIQWKGIYSVLFKILFLRLLPCKIKRSCCCVAKNCNVSQFKKLELKNVFTILQGYNSCCIILHQTSAKKNILLTPTSSLTASMLTILMCN